MVHTHVTSQEPPAPPVAPPAHRAAPPPAEGVQGADAAARRDPAEYARPWRSHMAKPGQLAQVLDPAPLLAGHVAASDGARDLMGLPPTALAELPGAAPVVMQEVPLGVAGGGGGDAAPPAGAARLDRLDQDAHVRLQVRNASSGSIVALAH